MSHDMIKPTQTSISTSLLVSILNEIFIPPSNQVIIDRFIDPSDHAAARCSGICEPGMCTFST